MANGAEFNPFPSPVTYMGTGSAPGRQWPALRPLAAGFSVLNSWEAELDGPHQ